MTCGSLPGTVEQRRDPDGQGKLNNKEEQRAEEQHGAVKGHWGVGSSKTTRYKTQALPKRATKVLSPPRSTWLPGPGHNVQCYAGHDWGHLAKYSPNRLEEEDMDCNFTVLTSVECQSTPVHEYLIPLEVEGKNTSALFDSGSMQTLVRRELVPAKKIQRVVFRLHVFMILCPVTTKRGVNHTKAAGSGL